jgi:hypothetical protein
MGKPLLLYGLPAFDNFSFEDDDGGQAPSGWDVTGTNDLSEVSDTEYHSAGVGFPSARSLYQNVDNNTAGNISIVRQRFDLSTLIDILRSNDVELAMTAVAKFEAQEGHDNALVRIRQYDATGTSTPGTGSLLTASSERWVRYSGPLWFLCMVAVKLHASAVWIDFELVYDMDRAGYNALGGVWWDRIIAGGLVDMEKGFTGGFKAQSNHGSVLNRGDGISETVKITGPSTVITAKLENILEGSAVHNQMTAMIQWLMLAPGYLAIWGDRDKLTNATRHWQKIVHDPTMEVSYPPGFARANYTFKFIAPNEGNS